MIFFGDEVVCEEFRASGLIFFGDLRLCVIFLVMRWCVKGLGL